MLPDGWVSPRMSTSLRLRAARKLRSRLVKSSIGLLLIGAAGTALWVFVWPVAATVGTSSLSTTLYVAPDGSDSANDCRAPDRPCASVRSAVANALAGDQVAVARGTYTENLKIRTPVKLLGGYDRRNWSRCLDPCRNTCMSVIDGDQSGWAVSVLSVTSGTAVVDGFTLTNGQGGLRVESSTVELVDCRIERNIGGWVGGAEVTGGSVVTITDSVIWGNGGSSVGAAIAALGSELRVERSTVAGNFGDRPGIVASLSPVYVSESILWDHEGPDLEPKGWPAYYVDWSDVQDALCKGVFSVGRGVFSADPLFVGPESGDLRLRARSPCIDAGRPDSPLDPDGRGPMLERAREVGLH